MSLGDPFHRLARDLASFEAEWPLDAARIIGDEATRQAMTATGGDGRLSGWKAIGTAGVQVSGGPGSATVNGVGRLWSVLENGTTAHDVEAKGRALRTPHGPRRRVHVRGVPGKQAWTRAMMTAERQVAVSANAAFDRLGG